MYYGTNMVLKSGKCRKVGRCFQYVHLQKTIPQKTAKSWIWEDWKVQFSSQNCFCLKGFVWIFWSVGECFGWYQRCWCCHCGGWCDHSSDIYLEQLLNGWETLLARWILWPTGSPKWRPPLGAVTSWLKTPWGPGRKVKKLRNYHGNWPPGSRSKFTI